MRTRRQFLGETSCAAIGSTSILSTLLNLTMANHASAQTGPLDFTLNNGTKQLSSVVRTYDPAGGDSAAVYKSIKDNLEKWIEEAVAIRGKN